MSTGSDKKTVAQITKELLAPFDPFDIEWRVQKCGIDRNGKKWAMVLAYVTNRAIMERLDSVFGINGWQNVFQPLPDGGLICGLKCKVPVEANESFEWIVKYDGADKTNLEATKGGLSNAMKRAGVQWGIGRYLYRLDTTFVELLDGRGSDDEINAYVKEFTKNKNDGGMFHFKRPSLPSFALPGETE